MGASLVALMAVAVAAAGVSAAEECAVDVSPAAGPAGTVFVFSGTGFVPAQLDLTKDDAPAGAHAIDVGEELPWEFSVRSRPTDEGTWRAEFSSDECTASAEFRVTLSNTATADGSAGTASPSVPFGQLVLLGIAGAGGGLILGRRLQLSARDNQSL